MRRIYLFTLAAFAFASCAKEKLSTPAFEVTAGKTTYQAGDTVTFHFTGNPEQITFYSGLPGYNYEFKDRTSAVGRTVLRFTTFGEYINADTKFQLMVSKDLRPPVDSLGVLEAAWTDISDRAVFSTGSPDTPSGDVELTDLAAEGEKLTFAFRFADKPKPTSAQRQATWTVKNVSVNNELPDSTYNILNMTENAWARVSFLNSANVWAFSATQLRIVGGNYLVAENDDWVVSKTFDPHYVKADVGIVVKDFGSSIADYSFVYDKPGTYKVAFVGNIVRPDKTFPVVKELTITVLP